MKKMLMVLASVISFQALAEQPKLIVQITVDQLRGDLLQRYKHNFIEDEDELGFNMFLDKGTLYTNAHYRHSATLTAVGHATLATGAIPSAHGLIGNNWFDVPSNSDMYCVADVNTKILQGSGKSASPVNLNASTFSDQLHMATTGKAKIYSVSVKDRGAVLTGGRFGKSFWFDKYAGDFVTSTYYYAAMPQWAAEFNNSGLKDKFIGASWDLTKDESVYHNDDKNRIFQIPPRGFNRGFPHNLPKEAGKAYYSSLTITPYGDWLTAKFAEKILLEQELGKDNITDYLAISFSLADYIGHNYGPSSLESEDNFYQLDKTLSDLFKTIDKEVGHQNVIYVLSADHGVDEIPEFKKSLGFAAQRGNVENKVKAFAADLQKSLKLDGNPLLSARLPNIYLNHQVIGGQLDKVNEAFANFFETLPEIARYFDKATLSANDFTTDPIALKVKNNFMPERSGDFVLVQKTSTMTANYSSATHGSPYSYDTHVPVYFTGWKIPAQKVTRLTSPEDVAVTLSATLEIGFPDKATGTVLSEIAEIQ
ncbi:MAG: alkaline phosphatase family protein [Alteromonadaceae bacterium]|nr:alkaline phosphatase family protein [Alteromonadaceae bacterium]